MVDVWKIRVGDEVTVRGTVLRTDAGIERPFELNVDGWDTRVTAHSIATHTPKPREFKPGDEVTLRAIVIDANSSVLNVNAGGGRGGGLTIMVSKNMIASHTPASRVFKIGDHVWIGDDRRLYEIVRIGEGVALLWSEDRLLGVVKPLSNLHHAESSNKGGA